MDVEYKCRILDHESGELVHAIEVTMTRQTAVPETGTVVTIADDTRRVSAAVSSAAWDFERRAGRAHVTVLLADSLTDGRSYR